MWSDLSSSFLSPTVMFFVVFNFLWICGREKKKKKTKVRGGGEKKQKRRQPRSWFNKIQCDIVVFGWGRGFEILQLCVSTELYYPGEEGRRLEPMAAFSVSCRNGANQSKSLSKADCDSLRLFADVT